jgi:hypothetical protein
VDNGSKRREGSVCICDAFPTRVLWKRQFIFVTAVSETNACNAHNHFGKRQKPVSSMQFRKELARKLLNYQKEHGGQSVNSQCRFMAKPCFKSRWSPTRKVWGDSTQRYHQQFCSSGCGKKIRTYCLCDPTKSLCSNCFGIHCFKG